MRGITADDLCRNSGCPESVGQASSLRARVGEVSPTAAYLRRVWIAAGLAGALSRAARWALPALPPLVVGALVLPLFGVLFLGISRAAGVPFAGRSESL